MTTLPGDAASQSMHVESELVRRSQRGDLDAFNALVDLHQRAVFNLCLRMVGNIQTAEDSTQDAFISAFRHVESFRGASFRAWLMRIAANCCTDHLRRRTRRPAISLEDAQGEGETTLDVPDATPGPEELAVRGEESSRVQQALLRLPADQRLAVVMCDLQGFSYEEIGEAMRCSLGTVKSRIARGREKLRMILVEEAGTNRAPGAS
jgi:RNA polymerase sigma-70 factor (ECF subfamily)